MARTVPDKQSEYSRRGRAAAVAADSTFLGMSAFARAGFTDPALVLRWSEIVGPEVARLCQPLRFAQGPSGGTLTLQAAPGAALFLAHEKRTLAERINTYLGRPAVAQIKFVQAALAVRAALKNTEKKPGPLPAADPARGWDGPEKLKNALLDLARRRNISP